ncbi:MAG: chemotaxis protein CheC [Candidatus Omnitrophica bacterium]|nr:chemotaxis protein CheC [Candidatus Omnitrophota bacterium]
MKKTLTENDIITEVGSICACNSTHAFSQMINRTLRLESPALQVIKFKDVESILQSKDNIVIGVHCQILAGILGQVSLLFKEKSAFEFVSIFASKEKQSAGFLTQLGVSTIKEVGNVVISAYSGAMSLLLDVPVIPSIPVLTSGPLKEVIKFGMMNLNEEDKVFVHTMTFLDEQRKINGSFYLVLEPETVKKIVVMMRKQLANLNNLDKEKLGAKKYESS